MSLCLGNEYLTILHRCGGYYACPKNSGGKREGPLVGYAGKYDGPEGKKLQFVGDVYVNFAKAEEDSQVLNVLANRLASRVISVISPEIGLNDKLALCAAPLGGYDFATALGVLLRCRKIKAEKKVVGLATSSSREKSELVFARHSVKPGRGYVIVEDVCNNFSTTEQLISLISCFGGRVVAIACFLNRSPTVDVAYRSATQEADIPVVALVRQAIEEWKQDDPAVAEDIRAGNVVWKPKDEWGRLMKAMG